MTRHFWKRSNVQREKQVEELVTIQLDENNPEKTMEIGALLTPNLKVAFEKILKENSDVFA